MLDIGYKTSSSLAYEFYFTNIYNLVTVFSTYSNRDSFWFDNVTSIYFECYDTNCYYFNNIYVNNSDSFYGNWSKYQAFYYGDFWPYNVSSILMDCSGTYACYQSNVYANDRNVGFLQVNLNSESCANGMEVRYVGMEYMQTVWILFDFGLNC